MLLFTAYETNQYHIGINRSIYGILMTDVQEMQEKKQKSILRLSEALSAICYSKVIHNIIVFCSYGKYYERRLHEERV